ncbi:MAG TPA: DNA starvation/stationary phase protection protein [Methylomirabilota bacterium]|nr:DNA starvation/stationary phase protection protein [Methylomirabilota bacterium]
MTVNIGIPDDNRQRVVALLNTLLADEYLLYTKTRNFHWNVTGPQFNDLHKFFEAQYEALDEAIDEVAERARALGGRAFGTLEEFRASARLGEKPGTVPAARDMLATLLADHEAVIRTLREDITAVTERHQDVGTGDFLTGLLEAHEKAAWMLRSFLV